MRNCSIRVVSALLVLGLALTAQAQIGQGNEIKEIRVESKAIPAPVEYEISRTVGAGRTHKVRDGKSGEVRRTYVVTLVDGEPISKKLIHEERDEPVSALILLGQQGFASSRHKFGRGRVLIMNATAYDPSPETIGPGATGRTYRGSIARFGIAAVDPRVIPFGTMLYIEGYGLALADDKGSAIKGNRIDLCYASKRTADRFGRQMVTVHILK